ncbi:MAG: hypothetical protein KIT69_06490 [Propionibacteriaceae bacterium]|nr:hypothetical protein [Propionibacteriaceae bacterium]
MWLAAGCVTTASSAPSGSQDPRQRQLFRAARTAPRPCARWTRASSASPAALRTRVEGPPTFLDPDGYRDTSKAPASGAASNADGRRHWTASAPRGPHSTTAPGNPNRKWERQLSQARLRQILGITWPRSVAVAESYPGGTVKSLTATTAFGETRTVTNTASGWRAALSVPAARAQGDHRKGAPRRADGTTTNTQAREQADPRHYQTSLTPDCVRPRLYYPQVDWLISSRSSSVQTRFG